MGVDAREGRESVWICVRVSLQRPETDRLDQFFYFTERNGDGLALTGVKLDLAFAGEPAECGNGFISLQSRDLRNLRDGQAFVTVFSKGGPEQSGRFSDSLFVDDRLFFFRVTFERFGPSRAGRTFTNMKWSLSPPRSGCYQKVSASSKCQLGRVLSGTVDGPGFLRKEPGTGVVGPIV